MSSPIPLRFIDKLSRRGQQKFFRRRNHPLIWVAQLTCPKYEKAFRFSQIMALAGQEAILGTTYCNTTFCFN